MIGEQDDPLRGTGRTTRLMYGTIIKALANPGKIVEFVDHWEGYKEVSREHKKAIEAMFDEFGVNNYCVDVVGGSVLVKALPNPVLEIIPWSKVK